VGSVPFHIVIAVLLKKRELKKRSGSGIFLSVGDMLPSAGDLKVKEDKQVQSCFFVLFVIIFDLPCSVSIGPARRLQGIDSEAGWLSSLGYWVGGIVE